MSLFCKKPENAFLPLDLILYQRRGNKNIVWIMIILNYTRSYATIYTFFFYFVLLCAEMKKTSSYSATSGLSGNTKQHP